MPRISVLLPVRNGASYIAAAVRSTLMSLPRDSKLYVMDDSSTDNTLTILDGIHDDRLVVSSKREKEPGLAGVLNELLKLADCEYVARMDADDITLPWRFRLQETILKRGGHDFVFSPVIRFGARKLAPQRFVDLDPDAFRRVVLLTNPVAHSTMFAKRDAIDSLGGYRSVHSEDYDLWIRAAARGSRIYRTSAPTLLYRLHANQVTGNADWARGSIDEVLLREAHQTLCEQIVGYSLNSLAGLRAPSVADASEIAQTRMLIGDVRKNVQGLSKRTSLQVSRVCDAAERRILNSVQSNNVEREGLG
jgi:glycosyltransferase involved in cell wall biosynthesis